MERQQWEYKVLEFKNYPHKIEAQINELGKEGWEAVSGFLGSGSNVANLHLLFKRLAQPA